MCPAARRGRSPLAGRSSSRANRRRASTSATPSSRRPTARRIRAPVRTLQANAANEPQAVADASSRNDLSVAQCDSQAGDGPLGPNHQLLAAAYRKPASRITRTGTSGGRFRLDAVRQRALEGLARLWREWGSPELALGDAHRAVHCQPIRPARITRSARFCGAGPAAAAPGVRSSLRCGWTAGRRSR